MRPRWRKVLSDLWDNKFRTLLVVASIAVGVFSVGTIAGAYVIISEDMDASYGSANPANIEIWTAPFDEDLIRSIEKVEGVKQAEGRRLLSVRASSDGQIWVSLDMLAIDDFAQMEINRLLPVSGDFIPGNRQILIEKEALEILPVSIGDLLQVQLSNGSIRKIPVAGVVQDQTTSAGDFLASPLGYVTFETMEWLQQPLSYNRLLVTVDQKPNEDSYIRFVSERVSDKLEKSDNQAFRTELSKRNEHPMSAAIQAALGVLLALGVLMVLLSSSLIANTLNALLTQHLRQIGVMKLVGARSYQILGMYIILIVAFGLIALAFSIPLSGQAAYGLADFIATSVNFNLTGYRVIPIAAIAQAVIALLVPLGAGFLPVRNGSRTKVRRAISGDRPEVGTSRATWINKFGKGGQSPLRRVSRPLLVSIRNTFRQSGRLALTLFTLTMGGAIFIAVFNVKVSLEQHIELIAKYFLADVTLGFDRPYRLSEVEQAAMQVDGVVAIEGWSFASAEILYDDGNIADNLQILAPPADSALVQPELTLGSWITPGGRNSLAVADGIWAIYPNLKPGDTLRLKVNGQEDDWRVVGIFQFIDREGILAYADFSYIAELTNLPNQAFSYRIVTEGHSLADQEHMSNTIDAHFRQQGFHVTDVEAGLNTLRTASEAIDILVTFLLIMAVLTALVGSIGLTGTMGLNVLERTREIGVMRAIGATDFEVIKTVIIEGTFIGLISWLLGMLLSFPISYMLLSIVSVALFESPIDMAITPQGFTTWMGVVLALSAIASILPARNAARLTIREVLAYE